MRNTSRVRKETWIWYSAAAFVLAVVMMVFCNGLSFISSAAEGKVTGNSVRIRKEASTSSDVVGSASGGETLSINSEVQGSDGKIWYQITKDGVTGYIRSDLMQKTEGAGGDTTLTVNPSVAVTNVNPVEGTITGGSQVRVRTDATTESGGIITYVGSGTKVTVKGQANGTDGKVWYLVIFNGSNGTVEGFIRSDYVNVSGELTPVDTSTPPEGEGTTTQPPVEPDQPEQKKQYDTRLSDDGIWYLQDYTKDPGEEWDIVKLIGEYKANAAELISEKGTVKTQKIVIIILVVFLIGAVLIATLLYFKVKDVTDEAYFAAVEKETLRERNAMRTKDPRAPVNSGRKVMQTVGTDSTRTTRQPDARSTGSKPVSQNPAGRSQTGAVRPANSQGRPVQTAGQPVRQAASAQTGTAQGRAVQPGGQTKPAAGVTDRPVQKPGQADVAQQRTVQAGQSKTAASTAQTRPVAQSATQQRPTGQSASLPKQTVSTKAKNVSDDDDEFEFEFLNWDGEEK